MSTLEEIVGPIQPKVEQRRRSIVLDYLLATSTHGLRSMGRAYSKFNRIFWMIAFTAAFGLMLYFVISSILQYYAYPTQTNIEIVLDRRMPFPAVTVCSANPYRYDRINASLVSYFYRLFPANTAYNQNILNNLQTALLIDLVNRNQTQELFSVGFQLSDLLLECTYNGIDCSNAFILSLSTLMGNCFTFNWQSSTPFFTLGDFSQNYVPKEGLSMAFYIPQEMYFPAQYYDIGLTIMLHNNDELPVLEENGIGLQPGLSHTIIYRKTETTFLQSPYTQCKSSVSTDMSALYQTTFLNSSASTVVTYSESICLELCEQAYVFTQCSCVFALPFLTRNVLTLDGQLVAANFCDPSTIQLQCAFNAQQVFSASEQLQTLWCTRCASQCQHTDFQTSVSAQSAPSQWDKANWAGILLGSNNTTSVLLPNDFAQNFDSYFNRNYLKVMVACGSKYVTQYNQEAKLTVIDTFSAIGGQSGLWIGLSVLSVIELSELFYRLLLHYFQQWKNERRARIEPIMHTIHASEKTV